METVYTEYKVKQYKNIVGKIKYNVTKRECVAMKPTKVIREEVVFKGTVVECESYLNLLNKNLLILLNL